MKGSFRARTLLVGMGILFVATQTQGMPVATEVTIQGHRCLVVTPKDLPADAPVVLILHGFGTNGDDLLSLCDELHLPPCLFVLPDAPFPIPHYPSVDHAWYNRLNHDRKDIESSRDYLFAVMDHFSKGTGDTATSPRPVILMGFSQGAVMSLEAGVNYKGEVLALVSMSGYMGEPGKTLAHPLAPRHTPILLTHGTEDPVVQDGPTQETIQALRKAGYRPVLKEFRGGHHLTQWSIMDVSGFLQEVLSKKRQKAGP